MIIVIAFGQEYKLLNTVTEEKILLQNKFCNTERLLHQMAYQQKLRVVKIWSLWGGTLFLLILPQKLFVTHCKYCPPHREENVLTKMKIKLDN